MLLPLSTATSLRSPTTLFLRRPNPHLPNSPATNTIFRRRGLNPQVRRTVLCRAEFAQDAPFAVAIGACILNSLVFPVSRVSNGEDGEASGVDSTDMRFGVMGIVSVIPYFNWLSWVFAWLDTGRPRYLVYSAVYLVPYLRTNLSLSPDESWLPIASIIICIIHVQLEADINNGNSDGFPLSRLWKNSSKKFQRPSHEKHKMYRKNRSELASARDDAREKLRDLQIPQKPFDKLKRMNEDENTNGGHSEHDW